MKFSIIIFSFFLALPLYSQVSQGGKPIGFQIDRASSKIASLPVKTVSLNVDSVLTRIQSLKDSCPSCRKGYYAANIDKRINIIEEGKKEEFDSLLIWRFKISAPGSKGLQIFFEKFSIPDEAKVFIYNTSGTMYIGSFNNKNNLDGGSFTTQPVSEDEIIIEYSQPAFVTETPEIVVNRIGYVFEDIFTRNGTYTSGDYNDICMIDVACPLGTGWDKQIRSVGLILTRDAEYNLLALCSGALINNTAQNGKPFFLTAYHCVDGADDYIRLQDAVVIFNYQNPTCGGDGSNAPINNSVSGATLISTGLYSSPDFADHALLELNEYPPANYNVCYNGWNKSEEAGLSSAYSLGIHHPYGDVKKICKDNSPPVKTLYDMGFKWHGDMYRQTYGNFWEVRWDNDQGHTWHISSGSPLFNSTGQLIGQLWGGSSNCYVSGNEGFPDYYGRLSSSWKDGELGFYLDPAQTGALSVPPFCPVYEPHCYNGIQDGNEQAVDCGGDCTPCAPGVIDYPPSCSDDIWNGDETGKDCGGGCFPCPSCNDGVQNQGETGIDCGGPCQPCVNFCFDGKHSGDELPYNADCGGSCNPCSSPLVNGGFEEYNYICQKEHWYDDINMVYPFPTGNGGCLKGQWKAAHGAPTILEYEDGNDAIFLAAKWYNESYTVYDEADNPYTVPPFSYSDGLYYQLPQNLDPYKQYYLHFKYKSWSGYTMDAFKIFAASGLQPLDHFPDMDAVPEFMSYLEDFEQPTYLYNKHELLYWEKVNNPNFYSFSLPFTVPNDQFNQIYFLPYQITGFKEAWLIIDDVVITEHPGNGPTCPELVEYDNESLPYQTDASKITARNITLSGTTEYIFKASEEVDITYEFEVKPGTPFKAGIEKCGISLKSSGLSPTIVNKPAEELKADEGFVNAPSTLNPKQKPVAQETEPKPLNTKVTVFPNPTEGIFTVQLENKRGSIKSIKVYSAAGNLVSECNLPNNSSEVKVNLKHIPQGTYIIEISTNETVIRDIVNKL